MPTLSVARCIDITNICQNKYDFHVFKIDLQTMYFSMKNVIMQIVQLL